MEINKVIYGGRTLIDLSEDTVTPETLVKGMTAHNAAGEIISGTMTTPTVYENGDYALIQKIVQNGEAEKYFNIGDQINVKWTYEVGGVTYDCYDWAWDVVHFADVELQDGSVVPGMYLQAHYTTPVAMPFDAQEAFYYAEDGLTAGTYCFSLSSTWGQINAGDTYEFTLAEDVAAGSQLFFTTNLYNVDGDGGTISVYASGSSTEVVQTATLTKVESSEATNLGTMAEAFQGNLGSEHTSLYGNNRWSQSVCRQWLNSEADKGEWWVPQNIFDRPPTQLASYPGFMKGFESDFLNVVQPVKVTTALSAWASSENTQEDTYDTFFLPSLEEQNIVPQVEGVEGVAWEYWKKISDEPIVKQVDDAFPLFYAINAQTTAQSVYLRSMISSSSPNVLWSVRTNGQVTSNSATAGYRATPACVIC